MFQLLMKKFFGDKDRVSTTAHLEEKSGNAYITPELHREMLAKKAAVAERRGVFKRTCSFEDWQRREFELQTRIRTNNPMSFKWVEDTEGTPVGFPLFVFHITMHDMFPSACNQFLTEETLIAGLRCNAVSCGRFVQIDKHEGFIEVQPRWVEDLGAE